MHHHWENHWALQAAYREALSYPRLSSLLQKAAGEERNQVSSTYQDQSNMVKQVNIPKIKIQHPTQQLQQPQQQQTRRNNLQWWW